MSNRSLDSELTQRADCRRLAGQLPILEDWLEAKPRAGLHVALLGGISRHRDRDTDVVREEIDDREPVDLFGVPHRQDSPAA